MRKATPNQKKMSPRSSENPTNKRTLEGGLLLLGQDFWAGVTASLVERFYWRQPALRSFITPDGGQLQPIQGIDRDRRPSA
jgi:hypothetical protein